MCVYVAIIAAILQVTLWRVNSAASLKCNGGYRLETWLAGHLDIGGIHQRGSSI